LLQVSQKAFEEKCEKIKGKILPYLDDFYGDPEEWNEASEDLVQFGVFYNRACDQIFKSSLLWDYNLESLAREYLYPDTDATLDEKKLQRHHYSLLMQYAISRTVVSLLLDGSIDETRIREASDYHYKSLKEYGYTTEVDAIKELDTKTMLSTFVPQIIVSKLLGSDYSEVIEHIDPGLKSSEEIWMYAWRLLHALLTNNNAQLKNCWNDLIQEWKACLVKSDFHAFSNSNFILLSYLYCQATKQRFNIKDFSRSILSAH